MTDHTDEHLHSLEKQSQVFVGGQIDRMKLRNADREREAGRKRTRDQDSDAAAELQGVLIAPQAKSTLIELRQQRNNAEDMIVATMAQTRAWRGGLLRAASVFGITPDWGEAEAIVQEAVVRVQGDEALVGQLHDWVRWNCQAEQPEPVKMPRLKKDLGGLAELRNTDADRAAARQQHHEQDDAQINSFQGSMATAMYQGATIEAVRQRDNAEIMIVDLMAQSLAWRQAVPLLEKEWRLTLDREQVDRLVHEDLADGYNDEALMAQSRAWAQQNYEAAVPAKVSLPRLQAAAKPKTIGP